MQRSTRTSAGLLALILGATCWAVPYFQNTNNEQQKQSDKEKKKQSDKDKNKQSENKNKDKNEPIFGGNITLKSSRKTSDSTTMGFSGLTPNGEVEAKKLKEKLTVEDYNKAQQVSFMGVKNSSLKKFIQDGKLNTAPARSATAAPKKG
ncbi:MAG TPA: hypothetical protein VFA71_01745 [Terriglobales bacterium]|nr:hypothetical protein [Terriglobales bacterium]